MSFSYLNAEGDVVADSTTALTLAQAQARIPEISIIVENAPIELRRKGTQTATQAYWHRKASGDGSAIEHYSQIEEIAPLQTSRMDEIDLKTRELIAGGFTYPPNSGQVFSLSLRSQAKIIATHNARVDPLLRFPQRWNTNDNKGVVTIPSKEGLHAFYMTAMGTVRIHLDSGTALKDQIRAATTRAEVDAVIDNR